MLSCLAGKKIINTIDYNHEDIRKWSNKGILKCPVCESEVGFRNGMIRIPHFYHINKDACDLGYYENETKEHVVGKTLLYKWLKNHVGVKNLQLESYIPETKQRPDIMFELFGRKYAVEYQCSPITLEALLERRKRYKLMEIRDFWIFGTENYNIKKPRAKFKAADGEIIDKHGRVIYLDSLNDKLHKVTSYGVFKFDFKDDNVKKDNFYFDYNYGITLPSEVDYKFEILLDRIKEKIKEPSEYEKEIKFKTERTKIEQKELSRLIYHRDKIRRLSGNGDSRETNLEAFTHLREILKSKRVIIHIIPKRKFNNSSYITLNMKNPLLFSKNIVNRYLTEMTVHIECEQDELECLKIICNKEETYIAVDYENNKFEKLFKEDD